MDNYKSRDEKESQAEAAADNDVFEIKLSSYVPEELDGRNM